MEEIKEFQPVHASWEHVIEQEEVRALSGSDLQRLWPRGRPQDAVVFLGQQLLREIEQQGIVLNDQDGRLEPLQGSRSRSAGRLLHGKRCSVHRSLLLALPVRPCSTVRAGTERRASEMAW